MFYGPNAKIKYTGIVKKAMAGFYQQLIYSSCG